MAGQGPVGGAQRLGEGAASILARTSGPSPVARQLDGSISPLQDLSSLRTDDDSGRKSIEGRWRRGGDGNRSSGDGSGQQSSWFGEVKGDGGELEATGDLVSL